MIQMLKEKALKGDIKAFEIIMDRTDGKPTQAVNMTQSQPIMPIINVAGLTGDEIDAFMESEQIRDKLDDVHERTSQRQ